MKPALRRLLFILFSPLTVPVYILLLAAANLLGGAYYIVVEASLARLVRHPITLSRAQLALWAVPVLVAAIPCAALHLVLFLVRGCGRLLVACGRWQGGFRSTQIAFCAGAVWTVAAAWTSLTCMNAALGSAVVGNPVQGTGLFVESMLRMKTLGDMPPETQQRRQQIIAEIQAGREKVFPEWERLVSALQDDDCLFRWLPGSIRRKLTQVPWYFVPAELSEDGLDHSDLMLGPLLFVWMLLIRWPGTFAVLRWPLARVAWFIVRVLACIGSVYLLITWMPVTTYFTFDFGPTGAPTLLFHLLSPAAWIGVGYSLWVRPEWILFNAGLWLVLFAVAVAVWWAGWWTSPLLGWPRYYVTYLAARLLQRKRIAFFSVGAVTLCVAMMIIVISVMGGFVDSIRDRAHGLLGDLVVDGGLQGFPYYDGFLKKLTDLKDEKTGEPLVLQATPLIHTYGILQFPKTKRTNSVSIWGVWLEEYVRVNEFGKDLFYQNRFGGTSLGPQKQPVYGMDEGGLPTLPAEMEARYAAYLESLPEKKRAEEMRNYRRLRGDLFPGPGVFRGPEEKPGYDGKEYPGVIIGRSILFRRQASGEYRRSEDYPRGELCLLTVMPITRGGDISPEPPPKPAFRYIDDSRTGIHEIDSMNVYVDFARLQELLSMGEEKKIDGGVASARCNQIQIKLSPVYSANRAKTLAAKERIWELWKQHRDDAPADTLEYAMLRQVDVSTWEEMQASYISAIEKEKFLVLIMFGVISIVAVFLILCIFYMIVQEKTRDIGIIKSLGGSVEGVAAVFLVYGGAIGLVGCILGSLLGTTFVENINPVQEWLARLNPNWRVWSPETYSFDRIPDVWKWSEVIWISILAICASVAGAAFPAIRAGRTWPVESLRYE